MPPAHALEGLDELWNALARVEVSEAAEQRTPVDRRRLDCGRRPSRVRNTPDRSAEARLLRVRLDVLRVDDQTRRAVEDLAREGKGVGPRLPRGRNAAVEDAVREQPAGNARVPLHRSQVCRCVLSSQRDPGDEGVEDEVVQNGDAE